jgi:hypothetical protein
MLENFIKFQNYKILRKTFLKFKIFQKFQNDKKKPVVVVKDGS